MKDFLLFFFWPNPGSAVYSSPKALALLMVCALLLLAAGVISVWRKRRQDARIRQISRSWASASFWFGAIGALLVGARVEEIQFLAMRFLWVLWGVFLLLYVTFQVKRFRSRYYQVLPSVKQEDPRAAYLPKPKRR